jgi:ATP-dependent Clp protease ATP-binding subunit ClpA
LVRRGIHKALGARPMKKTVQKFIGDAIRQALKSDASSSGALVISPIADHLTISNEHVEIHNRRGLSQFPPNSGGSFSKTCDET